MSSSEEEYGAISSGSDFEEVAPVRKTGTKGKAPAKAATKAPAKKTAASTKAAAAKKKAAPKRAIQSDDDDDDDAGDDTNMDLDEPVSRASSSKVANGTSNGTSKKKTASETYQKLTQLEHILKRPDSYIGSVETITQTMWAFDSDTKRMVHRDIKYVPGFFKIVDEILVNAADNKINDLSMDALKVNIDIEGGTISVFNNGRGIPIEIHSKEKIYIPELIFGHLLSSSNYDDDEKKLTGGRNGYGAKLANIYSHEFTVETADKNSQQKYKQTWTDNMSKCGKAKITKNTKGEEYTRITFRPDLKRFGMDSIDDDTVALLKKRVYDMSGTVKDVKVFLNDERLKIKNFKQYVELYVSSAAEEAAEKSGGAAQPKASIVFEQISPRWEVAYALSDGQFQHVAFANSIATTKGGTHVNYIADQIAKNLIAAVGKKNKGAAVKAAQIKNHMWLFVNALIENPTFDSQTKETLTLPSNKFGSKPSLSEDFYKKVQKSGIIDNVLNWAKFKADQQIKKTDGTKRSRLLGITKLSDANNAGTKKAKDCTLILTEGDSAKALAVAGLGVVGRDNFGVFPLRGKLLNVREARHDQIMKNEEIQNIKKIMGLQHNKDYTDVTSLRYGRLMIMTDQDHDGSHIKGLLINFLDHFYPSLLKIPDFLVEFVTPIVRVRRGKQVKDFFTIPEYEQWLEDTPDGRKWESKYYKGLGTSTSEDAKGYFNKMEKHMIPFSPVQSGDRELFELAFSKKKADERKEWLRNFKPGTYLDHRLEEIPYSEFIHKELILFSMADNIRSIPSIADGLKPGQRKVMWGCFKRKMKKEVKVAQLVGYISEQSAYHHGEQSLSMTIINLAQDFVGANNLALLKPSGQFGSRETGGKDAAAPRYLFTITKPISRMVFNIADDPLLRYLKDDDTPIEPEWYMPILPMVLINGAEGIGTGWSTNLPPFNPVDIVSNIRRMMKGEDQVPLLPWWRGFRGEIKVTGKGKYEICGVAKRTSDTTVEISELPIHKWTQSYKAELEAMITGEKIKEKKDDDKENEKDDEEKGKKKDTKKVQAGLIKDFKEHHDSLNILFEVHMDRRDLDKAEEKGLIEFFGLSSKMSTTNMMLFDFDSKIKKYDSPEDIIEDFFPMRLQYYQKRKDFLAGEIETALTKLQNQIRFIKMIIEKQLAVNNRKKADIVADLRKKEFVPFPKAVKQKSARDDVEDIESEDEEAAGAVTDFDYLLGMAIYSLTRERIEKLEQQAREKEDELLAMLKRSPQELWNTDLDQFLAEWENDCREVEAKANDVSSKSKKKQQKTLVTRKSIGFSAKREDGDDDFVPLKATGGAKKAPAKGSSSKMKDDDDEKRPAARRRIPVKKNLIDDDDDDDMDDDYGGLSATKPAARLAKAKERGVVDIDDEDEPVEKPTKKPAVKKPIAKKKGSEDESDRPPLPAVKKILAKKAAKEESGSEIEIVASKSKGKAPVKRKSPAVADDTSDDEVARPAAKRVKQTAMTDFLKAPQGRKLSKSMKPSPAKKKTAARMTVDDEDEGEEAPRRPARPRSAAVKTYVDIDSDQGGEGDDSMENWEQQCVIKPPGACTCPPSRSPIELIVPHSDHAPFPAPDTPFRRCPPRPPHSGMDFFSSTHDSNHISQHVDAFARAIAARPMNMPPAIVLPSSSSTSTVTTPRPAPPTPPSIAAFSAVPPTALDSWLSDPDTLILDIRPSGAYASARVPGAVSLSAPSTLLKRPSVPLRSLSNMLPPRSAKRFSAWPSAKRIMVYDADAAAIAESSNIFGLLRKFQNDGFKGEMAWLRGGFHSVWRERKGLVDTNPPTPDTEEDDDPGESPSHQTQASMLRPRLLSSTAFTLSSTLLGNSPHSHSKRGPLTLRNAQPSSSSAHHPAANPFFDTIRQNVELSHGITERIPLQLPHRVRRRLDDLNFVPWLQRIAKLAGRSTPRTHPLPSDTSSEDDANVPSSSDHYADALANQFFQIELAEQRRLMNIMQHHSQESGVVVVEENKEAKGHGFPYSITAGVEKGAKNRYRHIWPFEHARVKLQAKDDDYVNASYVQPLFTNKRYIATQGPLPATYIDFWTLCWEQNVHVIVMLTREVEGAMVKCGSYWSDHEYGPLRLRLVSTSQTHAAAEPEEPTGFFSAHAALPSRSPAAVSSTPRKASHHNQGATVRRVFELTHTGYADAEPRKIVHLQYLDWPDMNVPDDARGVLGLIKQVDEAVAEVPGEETPSATATISRFDPKTGISVQALGRASPVLLHCSAGVGRTGGFIVVDSILDAIRGELKEKKGKPGASADAMDVVRGGQTLSSGHTIHVPVADNPFSAPMDVDVDESEPPPLTEVSETSIDFPHDDFARTDTQKWAENVGAETSYGKDLAEGSQAVEGASLDNATSYSRSSSSGDSSAGRDTPSSTRGAHASSSLATSISSGPHTKLDSVPFFGKPTADHYRERTTSAPISIGLSKKRVPPSLSLGLGQLQANGASSTPSFSTPPSGQRNPSVTTNLTVNPPYLLSSQPFSFTSALQATISTSSLPPASELGKSPRGSPKAPRTLHIEGSPLPLSSSKDPIWDIVQDMREQRMSLCQSLRQYVFVHRAVIEGALMVLDEETGSGSNGDAFASSIDMSRVRDRVVQPRTAPSRFSSQPTRSSHSRSSSVSSRRFPSTSPSQRKRKGSSSRCQSPSPTESSSSSRHPIPPLLFQQALSMESLSSAASSHGKRSASPTELRKEGMQGEMLLSKRPSMKRKREVGHKESDVDESLAGSETVGGASTPSANPSSVASTSSNTPLQQRMAH